MQVFNGAVSMAVSDCEICSRLAEVETSFAKYGWEEGDRPLPPAAARLLRVGDPTTLNDEHHIRRCPLCGTLYRYDWSYEYHVNGSEDEEVLLRLTPDEARSYLTAEDYTALVAAIPEALQHSAPQTRGYAAKCLVSHQLALGEPLAARALLLHPDQDVRMGALTYIAQLVDDGESLEALTALLPALTELSAGAERDIANRARWTAEQLARKSGSSGSAAGSP